MVRRQDFESSNHLIIFKNLITGTEVLDYQLCKLTEIDDVYLRLTLPKGTCHLGHKILICLVPQQDILALKDLRGAWPITMPQNWFNFTASLQEIEYQDKDSPSISIVVKMMQYQKKEWESVKAFYLRIQKKINLDLKKMKD